MMRMIRMLMVSGLAATGSGATAQSAFDYNDALAEISLSATELCRTRPVENSSGKVRLTDQADDELTSLMKSLASLGLEDRSAFDWEFRDENARSDLALAIMSEDDCDRAVALSLEATVMGEMDSPDQPASGSTKFTEPVSDETLLKQLQGFWYSPRYRYGFVVKDNVGLTTISNAPTAYAPGDTMLRIDGNDKDSLTGTQIFTNGTWYTVSIFLLDSNTIRMEGGGFQWEMCRADWDGAQIGNPPCIK